VSIEFDPKKDAANLKKHGISLSEGDGVLNDPLALTIEDRSAEGEQRFLTIGTNIFGSLLVVVHTPRAKGYESSLCVRPTRKSEGTMKKVYDFSKGKRGAVIPTAGKTRITIYLDNSVLKRFKAESQRTGKGYQTLINEVLKSYGSLGGERITQELVRKIVREELAAHG
jgi:uncharacterized DUF497 family protein